MQEQPDLTAQTEYRKAPNESEVNINFNNCQIEDPVEIQKNSKAIVSASLADAVEKILANTQVEHQTRSFGIQDNQKGSTQKDESDLKTTMHPVSRSPHRSLNKSPSADSPQQILNKAGPNDFALVLDKKEEQPESLLDAVVRIDQKNHNNKSQGSEVPDRFHTLHPDSDVNEARKASIAFTIGGSESMYADDNRMNGANVPDGNKRDDDPHAQRKNSVEDGSIVNQ